MDRFSVELLEIDGDLLHMRFVLDGLDLEVVGYVEQWSDNLLVVRRFDIQGAGPNTLGPRRLRRLANQLKEWTSVRQLRVEGAARTSGAGPGRTPGPLVF